MSPAGDGFDVEGVRSRFTVLREGDFAFLDAPGGSLVPDEVADAIAEATRIASANMGGFYPTSQRVTKIQSDARVAGAAFMGGEPENIVLGPNMTTINFALTRAAARDFAEGDEIIVTALDHDGNVAPWRELARDRGLVLKTAGLTDDLRLDLDSVRELVTDRTRVIAFPWASNAVGTVTPAKELCDLAHSVGALAWVDAVHYAAHRAISAREIGADVLLCSPYKFAGPHLGMAHVDPAVASAWRAYKVGPREDYPLGSRFETGTQPYELLAGLLVTFRYLESIGGLSAIHAHEEALAARMLARLPEEVTVYGPALEHRVPTFLIDVPGTPAIDVARRLAERGVGVWHHDSWYAMSLRPWLTAPPETVRVGIGHYNSEADVDRLADELAAMV